MAREIARQMLDDLSSAKDWSTWDLLGGGLVSDMMKYDRLDKVQNNIKELQHALRSFRTELADLKGRISADISVEMGSFLQFADEDMKRRYSKMRKKVILTFMLLCVLALIGCSQKKAEPYVVNTFDKTPVEHDEESYENDEYIIMVKYYEMSDGTWKTDDYTYKYRLEISGRMGGAVKDSTFVFLSNTEDITFEQAWKASGFSSDTRDYFDEKDAKLVAMK